MNEVDPNLKKLGKRERETIHLICSEICSAFDRPNASLMSIMIARVLTAFIDAPGYAGCFSREFLETLKVHAMTKNMLYMALGEGALHLDRAIDYLVLYGVVIHIWHQRKSIYVLAESAYKLTPAMFTVRDVNVSKLFLRRIEKLERMYPADWIPNPTILIPSPTISRSLQA